MSTAKKGEGVHQSYKEEAKKGFDVLFHVTIKGRTELTDGIPLHMSVKIFKDRKEFDLDEIGEFAEEHHVFSPNPYDLTFKPIIFESERTKEEYFMLAVEGLGPQYKALYDEYDDVGNVYKKFFTHITIDKALYDDIKENGLKPDDIQFSNLTMEAGAGNTIKDFGKSEQLEKGVKHAVAGLAIAGAMAGPSKANAPQAPKPQQSVQQAAPSYNSGQMLRTIASVESNSGGNVAHKPMGGMHSGERAYGKYGLTPTVIRETIGMHRDLKQKYGKASSLRGDDIHRYMDDNPGLEDKIATAHLNRLEHHFGQDPQKIGYAWLEGIRGTYKAGKEKKDISQHWHVKKIKDAYGKTK